MDIAFQMRLPCRYPIIENDYENSAAYLRGWLDVLRLKDNKTWLAKAASEAQKAADYVLEAAKLQPRVVEF